MPGGSGPMNILHLTNSTLAGAPGMLSQAINHYSDHTSTVAQFNDKGPARIIFQPETLYLDQSEWTLDWLRGAIRQSDVIHIHNLIPLFALSVMAEEDLRDKKLIYQVHSPLYEPPNVGDLSDEMGLPFNTKLVIGHFHPRQFPDYKIVPNCLFRRNMFTGISGPKRDKFRVLFSPSSKARMRWNAKSSPIVNQTLDALAQVPDLELASFTDLAPEMLIMHRLGADISIDEVLSGSYHLVSYEGLACGNAVVNGCDDLSVFAFQAAFRTTEIPPFVVTNERGLLRTILDLARDRASLEEIKAHSKEFFWDVMAPERVVSIFLEIYSA